MSVTGLSPSVGLYFPVSSKELQNMKKQVLKQAYEQHLQRQRLAMINPEIQNNRISEKYSLKSSKSISFIPTMPTISKTELKIKEQSFNRLTKNESKDNNLIEHNDMLSFLQNYQNRQAQKKQRQKQEYKAFLQQQIARKSQDHKNRRSEEKQMQSVRANRRFGLMNKERSFKEYFSNVSKFRDNCSLQYISYHQQLKKREKAKAETERQAMLHQDELMKEQLKAETVLNLQKKQKLRNQLQQQMSQNRNLKASQLNQFKNRGYVKNEVDIYNTITNPIDYKIDVSNRYLLSQLFKGNQSKLSSYVVGEK